MKNVKLSALVLVTALASALPGGAGAQPSCVGQYASTFAREDGKAVGTDMSAGAQFASMPNFGAGVIAPFAHEPRDVCP
jgi:hypothetical protein